MYRYTFQVRSHARGLTMFMQMLKKQGALEPGSPETYPFSPCGTWFS